MDERWRDKQALFPTVLRAKGKAYGSFIYGCRKAPVGVAVRFLVPWERRQRKADDLAHYRAELLAQRARVVGDAVARAGGADVLGDLRVAMRWEIGEEVVLDLVAEVAAEDVGFGWTAGLLNRDCDG